MRQIRVCAWLVVVSAAVSACSGEKFTSESESGAENNPATPTSTAGTTHRNQAGTTSSAGGAGLVGAGGKAAVGGKSSDGSGGAASAGTSSGGASTSAGHSSEGGTSDSGSGGEPAAQCPSGTVKFRMLPGPDLGQDYLCDAGCGTGWLTITDAEGAMAYSLFAACGTASCDSCEVQPCVAAACLAKPLTAAGSELSWTGSFVAKGSCGANMTCQKSDCVKPGKYKAKACAAISGGASGNASCTPKNEQLCAEAVFEFPSTQTVQLVLKK